MPSVFGWVDVELGKWHAPKSEICGALLPTVLAGDLFHPRYTCIWITKKFEEVRITYVSGNFVEFGVLSLTSNSIARITGKAFM